jgi:type I restriction enzyme S subunit
MITGAYTVLESLGKGNSEYFELFYRAMDDRKLLSPLYSGLRNTIPVERFLGTKTPQPTPAEQAAIVQFLDWANGRLERAIRAKRKVMALLNEQKQAIIQRAVTRGLDPSISLKPSGIPWLGDIPQHWELRRLRTLVHGIDQGVSPLAVGFLAEGDSWGVLKSGCVNRGIFRETEHKQLARSFEIDPTIVVNVGDVLISRACGSPTLVGSVGRVKSLRYQLILSDKTFRACFRDSVDVEFMVFAMNCRYYRHQVEQAISGAEGMANNLPLSSLRDFSFAIPPTDEAAVIARYIENETAGLQTTICRVEREIELLCEYRTRLVADVVTGKLDVREAAAQLSEEVSPEVAEDEIGLSIDPEAAEEVVA